MIMSVLPLFWMRQKDPYACLVGLKAADQDRLFYRDGLCIIAQSEAVIIEILEQIEGGFGLFEQQHTEQIEDKNTEMLSTVCW